VSFRLRLTFFGAALVALTLLAFGWLVYQLVANSQATTQDDALKQRAADALTVINSAPPGELNGSAPPSLSGAEDLRHRTDPFTEILSSSGTLLSSTGRVGDAAPSVPMSLLAAAPNGGALATLDAPGAPQLRLYARPWARPDLGLWGFVVAGQPTSIQSENLKGLKGFLIVSSIPTLLAAFLASWLITGRALRPLKTVVETTDSIARTRDFKRRLPPAKRRDEIGLLSASFNRMLDQVEAANEQLTVALEAQRRFVADASHELRTPLTTIRGNAGLLAAQGPAVSDDVRAAAAHDIATESERMSRLVEHLLTLAQADAGQHLDLAPVDLRSTIESVCRQAQVAHPDRTFRSVGVTDATVPADIDAVTQLLWILVDNAVKFTKPGGGIELGLSQFDSKALLTVADDGTGIPPDDLERVFERFYQADPARSNNGAGLGLSIAHWIVEEHHGTIAVRNNTGPGCTFTVTLPLAG
jgi:signal transduction histidine kinase